jgi:UPF0042 nucleotide-binding protein
MTATLHASCIAWGSVADLAGGRRRAGPQEACLAPGVAPLGLLLTGPSGSGKSGAALRLMAEGARLVADDQVVLTRRGGDLLAAAPPTLAGLMELSGLGLVAQPHWAGARLVLQIELVDPAEVARLPDAANRQHLGVKLPCLKLSSADPAFIAKVQLALQARARLLSDNHLTPAIPAPPGPTPGPTPGRSLSPAHLAKDLTLTRPPSPPDDGPAASGLSGPPAAAPPAGQTAGEATGQATGQPVVLVTGLAGAGRSSALKILEDLGYEAMDNLPLDLMAHVLNKGALDRPLALGADPRSRRFSTQALLRQRAWLRAHGNSQVTLLFLDCDDEVLQHRFTETRRRHPLATDRPLLDGISAERGLLEPLQQQADFLVDSSRLSLAELRRLLVGRLSLANSPGMQIFVSSFSYRKGLPREADLVFDVRFLKNPHYVAALRPLTGQDRKVADHIAQDPAFAVFFQQLTNLLDPLLPRYAAEGKSYLTLAFGCTGGQHRSVALAEKMAEWLADQGQSVLLTHREIDPTARHIQARDRAEDS